VGSLADQMEGNRQEFGNNRREEHRDNLLEELERLGILVGLKDNYQGQVVLPEEDKRLRLEVVLGHN